MPAFWGQIDYLTDTSRFRIERNPRCNLFLALGGDDGRFKRGIARITENKGLWGDIQFDFSRELWANFAPKERLSLIAVRVGLNTLPKYCKTSEM